MKKPLIQSLALCAVAGMMLTACSQGAFKAADNNSVATDPGNNSQGDGSQPANPSNPLSKVDMKGYVDSSSGNALGASLLGSNSGLKAIDLDADRGELILNVSLGLDSSILMASGSVPQYPDVSFSTTIGSDGKMYLTVRVPLKYFLHGVTTMPANRLPNGDALPKMPAGEGPTIAFDLNTIGPQGKKVYLYVGVDAIGVFVESTLPTCQDLHMPICLNYLSFDIKNMAKTKVIGSFTLVMPKNGFSGGFFLGTPLDPQLAVILDEILTK